MKIKTALLSLAALAITLTSVPAAAMDFGGYLRGGPGFNSSGGTQACFQLPGSYFKARLGNECDRYGEFLFAQTTKTDSLEWRAEFMPAFYQPLNLIGSVAGNLVFVQQAWVGLTIPDLGGVQFWAGRRYYDRHDVHSLDWFYWNLQQGNNSFGIDGIKLGSAKGAFTLTAIEPVNNAGQRGSVRGIYVVPGVRVSNIAITENANITVGVDVAMANDQIDPDTGAPYLGAGRAATSEFFTAEFNLNKFLGGSNRLAFQYGNGALAQSTGDGPLNVTLKGGTTDDTQWRVIEHLVFEASDFSGAFVLVYQDISGSATSAIASLGRKIATVELRPAYSFTPWFKLAADLFYQSITSKDAGVDSTNLTKITIAPTLVAGKGYYARPELRLYYTYASWNAAAATAGMGQGAFGPTATSGSSIGVQGEIWF